MKTEEAIQRALREARSGALGALARVGISDAAEVRIALARRWRKNSHGGRAIPRAVVLGMYAIYERTHSLRKTGDVFGRDAGTMGTIFKNHGLALSGRGGANHRHDRATVRKWFDAYCALRNLEAVGKLFGKRGNTVGKAFKSHGFPVRPRGGADRWKQQIRERAA